MLQRIVLLFEVCLPFETFEGYKLFHPRARGLYSQEKLHLANLEHFGGSLPLTSDEWQPLKLLYRHYKMLSSTLSTTINRLYFISAT